MAVYAIGDVQGCYDELRALLDKLRFDPVSDCLWFAGDLVNRGPKSAEVLRFVKGLGERAVTVLGNHDLHLVAMAEGHSKPYKGDTLAQVLDAPDADELLRWLRHRPMLHHDEGLGYTLVHAGLPPEWGLDLARQCAGEVEVVLRGPGYQAFLAEMYGNKPNRWSPELAGMERLRFAVNCFTRMRYCQSDGKLLLKEKGSPDHQPAGVFPWFDMPGRESRNLRIIFGHWSTLPVGEYSGVVALDSGCVWGGRLTAVRLGDGLEWVSVGCAGACAPGEL